jgi:hypothetical protein
VLLAGLHRSDRRVTTVRPAQAWADRGLVFVRMVSLGLVLEVVVLVVGLYFEYSCGKLEEHLVD